MMNATPGIGHVPRYVKVIATPSANAAAAASTAC